MNFQEIFPTEPQNSFDLGQPRQEAIGFPLTLAERYQPRQVADFVGIAGVKRVMTSLLEQPRPCALLFIGGPGTGKSSMAMAFAEQLPGSLHHVSAQKCDVATLDALNDKFAYYPPRGKFWICLVDEADQMTEKAQLQLLSRLDGTAALKPMYGGGFERGDPPPIIWIFTCNGRGPFETEPPASLAQRFRERCMMLPFPAVTTAELAQYLDQIWNLEAAGRLRPNTARIAEETGNVRAALMKLDLALMGGLEPEPVTTVTDVTDVTSCEKPSSGIISPAVIDLVSTMTETLGQREAETMLQYAVRDCGLRLLVDGRIGRLTIAAVNRIPESKLLEALRRRAAGDRNVA
jgi:hypothetical protein